MEIRETISYMFQQISLLIYSIGLVGIILGAQMLKGKIKLLDLDMKEDFGYNESKYEKLGKLIIKTCIYINLIALLLKFIFFGMEYFYYPILPAIIMTPIILFYCLIKIRSMTIDV